MAPAPPTGSFPPSASSSAAASFPAVSFPPSSYAAVSWEISPLGAGSDGAQITKLVMAGDRVVAIGGREGTALAWWSDDFGQTWTPAALEQPSSPPSDGAVAVPRTAAASGQRLVASGFWVDPAIGDIRGPVTWTSEDGRAWEVHDLGDAMPGSTLDAIIGTEDGFIATGYTSGPEPFGWWFSTDGVVWQDMLLVGLPDLNELPPAMAWNPDLLLVGGGYGSRSRPGIWASSADGITFDQVLDDAETMGWVTALAHAEYGWVAAGQREEGADDASGSHVAAWISADGRAWRPLALEAPAGTVTIAVAANESGAVILGWSLTSRGPQAWFLPGGAGLASIAQLPVVVHDMIALEDRFVAVGGCPQDEGCTGPVIMTGMPTEDAAVPDPTLPPAP